MAGVRIRAKKRVEAETAFKKYKLGTANKLRELRTAYNRLQSNIAGATSTCRDLNEKYSKHSKFKGKSSITETRCYSSEARASHVQIYKRYKDRQYCY